MKIRECVPSDAESVLVLWRLADATTSVTDNVEDIRKGAVATSTHFLVAEADDKFVGTIIGGFDGWRGNVYRLAVHPDYRRRGIARRLVSEIGRRFADQGVKRVTALVEKDHPSAMALLAGVRVSA